MDMKKLLYFPGCAERAPIYPVPGPDGKLRFPRERTPEYPVPGPDGIFRFPREREPEQPQRFPRLKNTDDKDPASLAELVHRARVMMMGNFQTIRFEMGRLFCRIKHKLQKKGLRWKAFYMKKFNASIVSYRTACRFMERWRRAQERETGDRLSLKPGTSRQFEAIDAVTREVQREVRADHDDAPKPESDYRLSIRRPGAVRRAAVSRMWQSKHRDPVEKNVVAVLDEGLTKYKFATKNELRAEEVAR